MVATDCPGCGSEWDASFGSAVLHMRRCRGCGLLAPIRPPGTRDLEAWYKTEYWKHYREEQTSTGRDNIYRHVLAWLERLRPERGTVLDVGCGGGRFLVLCQANGWRTIGVEPSQEAAVYARRRGVEVHSQAWPALAIPDESVEAVTFINVLDHLSDPFLALREAGRVLKPDGLLYIRVPNAALHAWAKRLLAPMGLDQVATLHLYGFGRRTFPGLLPRFGFRPFAVRTAPPAKGHPYKEDRVFRAWAYLALKVADRSWYWLSRVLLLDRLGWGPSLEVMARKTPGETGAHP